MDPYNFLEVTMREDDTEQPAEDPLSINAEDIISVMAPGFDNMKPEDKVVYNETLLSTLTKEEKGFRCYLLRNPESFVLLKKLLHCTVCTVHMGCKIELNPIDNLHPRLKVLSCGPCTSKLKYTNYTVTPQGHEDLCRWCGEPSTDASPLSYCCRCPFAFCAKCLYRNIGKDMRNNVDESWMCCVCDFRKLWYLRALAASLMSFIVTENKENRRWFGDISLCCSSMAPQSSQSEMPSNAVEHNTPLQAGAVMAPEIMNPTDFHLVMDTSWIKMRFNHFEELLSNMSEDVLSTSNMLNNYHPADGVKSAVSHLLLNLIKSSKQLIVNSHQLIREFNQKIDEKKVADQIRLQKLIGQSNFNNAPLAFDPSSSTASTSMAPNNQFVSSAPPSEIMSFRRIKLPFQPQQEQQQASAPIDAANICRDNPNSAGINLESPPIASNQLVGPVHRKKMASANDPSKNNAVKRKITKARKSNKNKLPGQNVIAVRGRKYSWDRLIDEFNGYPIKKCSVKLEQINPEKYCKRFNLKFNQC